MFILAVMVSASLKEDNGALKQVNVAKIEVLESNAREQVNNGVTAVRFEIASLIARDKNYKANEHAGEIQDKLIQVLNNEMESLNGAFDYGKGKVTGAANEITVGYTGQDYQGACKNASAKIVYTISLTNRGISVSGEINSTLKDQNGEDFEIDVGGSTGSETGIKLVDVASIGDYVNYDPTTGGNVNATNTKYTSMPGSTTKHGNGYTTLADGQTFSAQAYKNSGGKWRILEKNSDGTITLISDYIYRDNEEGTEMLEAGSYQNNGFYTYGAIGYLWAEEEMHRIAAVYGYGYGADTNQTITYYYGGPNDQDGSIPLGTVEAQQGRKATMSLESGARSITVKDINKICGKEEEFDANFSWITQNKNTNNIKYYPTVNGNSTTGINSTVSSASGKIYSTTYYPKYVVSAIEPSNEVQAKQIEILDDGTRYRIASRMMSVGSESANFGITYVSTDMGINVGFIGKCSSGSWKDYQLVQSIRAIVFLKSGIKTSDSTYNSNTGWNIAKE